MKQRFQRTATILIAVLGLVCLSLTSASAAYDGRNTRHHSAASAPSNVTIYVNTNADGADADSTDGDCTTRVEDNICTLRAAIQEANAEFAASGGTYTIVVPTNTYDLTLTGDSEDYASSGDLDIRGDLVIQGAGEEGTNVTGEGDRVFHILSGHVTLSGISIMYGHPPPDYGGGGIRVEPGATLKLVKSNVSHNSTYDYGGGIENYGVLQVVNSIIGFNNAAFGAGVANWSTAKLLKSTITQNIGEYEAGGIRNKGTLKLLKSTVSQNKANQWDGGGIKNLGKLAATNSTIAINYGNQAGGGILNQGTVNLLNATIAYNSTDLDNPGAGIYDDVAHSDGQAVVYARNSIIANNGRSDCWGKLTSQDHNLITNTTDCAITGSTAHNKYGVNPKLGELQNNGGPTQTFALLRRSPAIDHGDPSVCPATDQRGHARPVDGNNDGKKICDIGAYEYP